MTRQSTALSDAQRELLNDALSEWFAQATETDYETLEAAHERVAAGQVCSIVNLVQRCYAQGLTAELPETLVRRLQERNWPQAGSASKSA